MKLQSIIAALLSALCLLILNLPPAHAGNIRAPGAMMRLKPGTRLRDVMRRHKIVVDDSTPRLKVHSSDRMHPKSPQQLAQELATDPAVAVVEADRVLLSPEAGARTHYVAHDGGGGDDVNYYVTDQVGWVPGLPPGKGVTVAVIDTGIDPNNAELAPHIVEGYNFITPELEPDEEMDGTIDNSAYGHGTACAGLIHEFGSDIQIMPLRVLNGDGFGLLSDVVDAIDYAVDNGANVISMSFSSKSTSRFLQEAIARAHASGVLLVAAAGNTGDPGFEYPAALPHVLSVISLEIDDSISFFSNYGGKYGAPAVAAPGSGLLSLAAGSSDQVVVSGTSFSAPIVAAEAALCIAKYRNRHPQSQKSPKAVAEELETVIRQSSVSVERWNDPGYAGLLGTGIINFVQAMQEIQ